MVSDGVALRPVFMGSTGFGIFCLRLAEWIDYNLNISKQVFAKNIRIDKLMGKEAGYDSDRDKRMLEVGS